MNKAIRHAAARIGHLAAAQVLVWLFATPALASPSPRMVYVYNLASITGHLSTTAASLAFDPRSNEVLVVDQGRVRVFNDAGMEVFAFGTSDELGGISSIAAMDESGDYLVLGLVSGVRAIVRCDYRGAPIARIEPSGLPAWLSPFTPEVVGFANGLVYLGDQGAQKVVVLDLDGAYVKSIDLAAVMGTAEENGESFEKGYVAPDVRGLQFDASGNTLFTAPTLFRAYVVAPDGAVRSFGKKGGTAGKFNVVVAMTSDADGNLYVADTLRSSVSVFGPDLQFVQQFGGRGYAPGRLIGPAAIVAGNGKLYVSQGVRRGVSVFARPAPKDGSG